MPSHFASSLADLRRIPLSEVLSDHGLEPHKEGNSTMWRGNAWAINVTGDSLWFDHKAGKGSNGAIDLVMHLKNVSFKEAVASLSGGPAAAAWTDGDLQNAWDKANQKYGELEMNLEAPIPERRPLPEMLNQYAKRDDSRWPNASRYLTNRRGLPLEIVEDLYKAGRVYANDRGAVVFLHHDMAGKQGGATIKSTNPHSPFSQCIGNKTGAWFHVGCPPAEAGTIAITESPIDAISYSVLHPSEHLSAVSVAGQYIPDQLLQLCHDKNVVVGIDNPAFEHSAEAQAITQKNVEITFSKCPHAIRYTPLSKDWNDDLCAARKRHVKTL